MAPPPKNIPDDLVPQVKRLRMMLRAAAAFDVVYLVCWFMVLQPTLNLELDFYSSSLDPIVGAMRGRGIAGHSRRHARDLERLAPVPAQHTA